MLYQRIRDLREDNDLKQSQLSEKLNITLKTYQRYERGETPITLEIAEQLATIYKVSLDYIAGKTNDKRGFNKIRAISRGNRHNKKIPFSFREAAR